MSLFLYVYISLSLDLNQAHVPGVFLPSFKKKKKFKSKLSKIRNMQVDFIKKKEGRWEILLASTLSDL